MYVCTYKYDSVTITLIPTFHTRSAF